MSIQVADASSIGMTRVRVGTSAGSSAKVGDVLGRRVMLGGMRGMLREQLGARGERTGLWRDIAQSYIHDVAEISILSRLISGQVALLLGYASLRGVLALRRRTRGARSSPGESSPVMTSPSAHPRRRPLLIGATVGAGLVGLWASLAFISRIRAVPALTAVVVYGRALRGYLPRVWPLAGAA